MPIYPRHFPRSISSWFSALTLREGVAPGGEAVGLTADMIGAATDSLGAALADSTIYFLPGSTGLGRTDRRKLSRLAEAMLHDTTTKIEIVGHCDPSGDAAINERLAQLRCRSTHDFLLSKGVPQDRFVVRPVGAKGKSGGSSAEQRRVDFRIASGLLAATADAEPIMADPTMTPIALDGDEGERLVKVKAYAGGTKVYFDTAKSSISRMHRQQLDQLAAYLKSFDKVSPELHVRGFADPRGDATFNMRLSSRRCKAVVDYLKGKGVRPEVIVMEEQGATRVDVNDTAALRESRRVEFTLKAPTVTNA